MIDLPQAIDRKLELILMAARDTSSGIHSPASLADMRRREALIWLLAKGARRMSASELNSAAVARQLQAFASVTV